VFNKAGHINYYWLAGCLFALGIIAAMAESSGRDPAKSEEKA
jgi:hypothetical protein